MRKFLYIYTNTPSQLAMKVVNQTGQTVWQATYPGYYENATTGEMIPDPTLLDAGVMKSLDDLEGLKAFLVQAGVLAPEDVLSDRDYIFDPMGAVRELVSRSKTWEGFFRTIRTGSVYGVDVNDALTEALDLKTSDPAGNTQKLKDFYYHQGKDLRKERKAERQALAQEAGRFRAQVDLHNILSQAHAQNEAMERRLAETGFKEGGPVAIPDVNNFDLVDSGLFADGGQVSPEPWMLTKEEFGEGAVNDWPLAISSKGMIKGEPARDVFRRENNYKMPFFRTPEAAQAWVDKKYKAIVKQALAEGKYEKAMAEGVLSPEAVDRILNSARFADGGPVDGARFQYGDGVRFVRDATETKSPGSDSLKYREGQNGVVININSETTPPTYYVRVGLTAIKDVPQADLVRVNEDLHRAVEQRLEEKQKTKEFKDVGRRVSGSKKEQRAYSMITFSDLADIEQDEVTAMKLVVKDKVYPEVNLAEQKAAGVSSGAAFLKVQIRLACGAKPPNSAEKRASFIKFIEEITKNLGPLKTVAEVRDYLRTLENLEPDQILDLFFDGGFQQRDEEFKNKLRDKFKRLFPYQSRSWIMNKVVEEVFGKRFSNFIFVSSDPARVAFEQAKLYEHLTEEQSAALVSKYTEQKGRTIAVNEDNIKRYEGMSLKELQTEFHSWRGMDQYKKDPEGFRRAAIRYYQSRIDRARTEQQKVPVELMPRPDDWSWSEEKEKKEVKKSAEIQINAGVPLNYIKRTGGLTIKEEYVNEAQNTDPEKNPITKDFGFKSVQFGNAIRNSEAREHIRHFLGAMTDLAEILDIDIKQLNGIGGLSIAFAARGSGRAAATYERGRTIINITNNRGDGCLAHEFGHYFDNAITIFGKTGVGLNYGSELAKEVNRYGRVTGLKNFIDSPEVTEAMEKIVDFFRQGKEGVTPTVGYLFKAIAPHPGRELTYYNTLLNRSSEIEYKDTIEETFEYLGKQSRFFRSPEVKYPDFQAKMIGAVIHHFGLAEYEVPFEIGTSAYLYYSRLMSSDYWVKPWELFARAWETYIFDKLAKKGRMNNYLVSGYYFDKKIELNDGGYTYVYPFGAEREYLFTLYDNLVQAVKHSFNLDGYTPFTDLRVDEYVVLAEGDKKTEKPVAEVVVPATPAVETAPAAPAPVAAAAPAQDLPTQTEFTGPFTAQRLMDILKLTGAETLYYITKKGNVGTLTAEKIARRTASPAFAAFFAEIDKVSTTQPYEGHAPALDSTIFTQPAAPAVLPQDQYQVVADMGGDSLETYEGLSEAEAEKKFEELKAQPTAVLVQILKPQYTERGTISGWPTIKTYTRPTTPAAKTGEQTLFEGPFTHQQVGEIFSRSGAETLYLLMQSGTNLTLTKSRYERFKVDEALPLWGNIVRLSTHSREDLESKGDITTVIKRETTDAPVRPLEWTHERFFGSGVEPSALTKQLLAIKTKYPDAVILARVGDFYEAHGEDAVVVSTVLDLPLTHASSGYKLAGFPHHALDANLITLVKAGHKVALLEDQAGEVGKNKPQRPATKPQTAPAAATASKTENHWGAEQLEFKNTREVRDFARLHKVMDTSPLSLAEMKDKDGVSYTWVNRDEWRQSEPDVYVPILYKKDKANAVDVDDAEIEALRNERKVGRDGKKAPKRSARAVRQDLQHAALPPGKRVSASGKVYYEYRANRSDDNSEKRFAEGGSVEGDFKSVAAVIEHLKAGGSFSYPSPLDQKKIWTIRYAVRSAGGRDYPYYTLSSNKTKGVEVLSEKTVSQTIHNVLFEDYADGGVLERSLSFSEQVEALKEDAKAINVRLDWAVNDKYVTLYHGTSQKAAQAIKETGFFKDGFFFSKKGQSEYGDSVQQYARNRAKQAGENDSGEIVAMKVSPDSFHINTGTSELESDGDLYRWADGIWRNRKETAATAIEFKSAQQLNEEYGLPISVAMAYLNLLRREYYSRGLTSKQALQAALSADLDKFDEQLTETPKKVAHLAKSIFRISKEELVKWLGLIRDGGVEMFIQDNFSDDQPYAEGGLADQSNYLTHSTHVRNTLVDKEYVNSLPEEKRKRIVALVKEYNESGYIDATTQLGPDQARRMSDRQRDSLTQTASRVFRMEDEVKQLLKPDDQESREQKEAERKQLSGRKLQLERYIENLQTMFPQKLESKRDNPTKRSLAGAKEELALVDAKLLALN